MGHSGNPRRRGLAKTKPRRSADHEVSAVSASGNQKARHRVGARAKLVWLSLILCGGGILGWLAYQGRSLWVTDSSPTVASKPTATSPADQNSPLQSDRGGTDSAT